MKFNYLIKAVPILSTIFLIILFSVSNQKEYTKLRILIWNTPSLSLGRYLAISTGTGFILSYLITTNLANTIKSREIESTNINNENKYEESNKSIETNTRELYDNILIERNIKDPSPTINASFRIIARTESSNINYGINDKTQNNELIESEELYDEHVLKNEFSNKVKSESIDWNDDSYSQW